MGISGPVASGGGMGISGPVAGAGGSATPFSGSHSMEEPATSENRSRSFRVLALVLGMFAMAMLAMIVAVVVIVVATQMGGDGGKPPPDDGPTEVATKTPTTPKVEVDDTGAVEVAAPKVQEQRRRSTRRRSSGGGTTTSNPAPPRTAPKPSGPAPISITLSNGVASSVQITCGSSFRQRASFRGGKATVADVPQGQDCKVSFKGGTPASFNKARAGNNYSCDLSNAPTAVCN